MNKNVEKIAVVYCVTCYGKLVGVYADAQDAFAVQMQMVSKSRIAEMVPSPVIYPENMKSNE